MIEWSDGYLIGHPKLDSQHKMLVELLRELEIARAEDVDVVFLQDLVQEIIMFTKFHFKSEENVMARIGYPDLAHHRELHFHLMDVLNTKIATHGLAFSDSVEAQNFILDWFVKHSSTEDAKIVAFQNAKAIARQG
jgi:hemerythrin